MKECIDEARLQAYWDGELTAPEMSATAAHLASCARCAAESQAVEAEMEMLTRAFAPQLAAPVPTETLRARLTAAIAREEDAIQAATLPVVKANENHAQTSFGTRLRGWLQTLNLTPQAFAYSALTLLVAGMVGAFWWQQNRTQTILTGTGAEVLASYETGALGDVPVFAPPQTAPAESNSPVPAMRRPVSVAPNATLQRVQAAPQSRVERNSETVTPAAPALLPGEASYLNAIASLQKVVGDENNLNAQPKLRSVYEQNVALLDHAIQSSQRNARRNPKDTDAAQLLYSTYQSKVELMTSVAEQMQTLAEAR